MWTSSSDAQLYQQSDNDLNRIITIAYNATVKEMQLLKTQNNKINILVLRNRFATALNKIIQINEEQKRKLFNSIFSFYKGFETQDLASISSVPTNCERTTHFAVGCISYTRYQMKEDFKNVCHEIECQQEKDMVKTHPNFEKNPNKERLTSSSFT